MKIYSNLETLAAASLADHYAVTFGKFDGLHLGHQSLLNTLKEMAFKYDCKTLVISLLFNNNSDGDEKTDDAKKHAVVPGLKKPAAMVSSPYICTKLEREKILQKANIDCLLYLHFEVIKQLSYEVFLDLLLDKLHIAVLVGSDKFTIGFRKQGAPKQVASYLQSRINKPRINKDRIKSPKISLGENNNTNTFKFENNNSIPKFDGSTPATHETTHEIYEDYDPHKINDPHKVNEVHQSKFDGNNNRNYSKDTHNKDTYNKGAHDKKGLSHYSCNHDFTTKTKFIASLNVIEALEGAAIKYPPKLSSDALLNRQVSSNRYNQELSQDKAQSYSDTEISHHDHCSTVKNYDQKNYDQKDLDPQNYDRGDYRDVQLNKTNPAKITEQRAVIERANANLFNKNSINLKPSGRASSNFHPNGTRNNRYNGHYGNTFHNEMSCNEVLSTAFIKKMLKKGSVDLAMQLMWLPFSLKGRVVHGNKQGRLMGYPTANFIKDAHKTALNEGTYITLAYVHGTLYRSLTFVGDPMPIATHNQSNPSAYPKPLSDPLNKPLSEPLSKPLIQPLSRNLRKASENMAGQPTANRNTATKQSAWTDEHKAPYPSTVITQQHSAATHLTTDLPAMKENTTRHRHSISSSGNDCKDKSMRVIETFLLDFTDSVYNKDVVVYFLMYLRKNIIVKDHRELQSYIKKDQDQAITYFKIAAQYPFLTQTAHKIYDFHTTPYRRIK